MYTQTKHKRREYVCILRQWGLQLYMRKYYTRDHVESISHRPLDYQRTTSRVSLTANARIGERTREARTRHGDTETRRRTVHDTLKRCSVAASRQTLSLSLARRRRRRRRQCRCIIAVLVSHQRAGYIPAKRSLARAGRV